MVEAFSLRLVDEGHAALLETVLFEELILRLHEHIHDGVPDAHDIKLGIGIEPGCAH